MDRELWLRVEHIFDQMLDVFVGVGRGEIAREAFEKEHPLLPEVKEEEVGIGIVLGLSNKGERSEGGHSEGRIIFLEHAIHGPREAIRLPIQFRPE